ncbi:MAG: protein kinase [Akkermansia sp.]|nr:protein kinase [Akkermansia sp.]
MQQQNTPTLPSTDDGIALPAGVCLGRYRLLGSLGQGGFGITYLAETTDTDEKVVIKENMPTTFAFRKETTYTVSPLSAATAEGYNWAKSRFIDEACLLASLDHPNIVKVTEAFEAYNTAYYVMPHVNGRELGKAAPKHDAITEDWLAPVLTTLLNALRYLHDKNIFHRDIKPNNILLKENGELILIDFGAARQVVAERSATLLQTPGYTPIEQIQHGGNRGAWSDIYSLGATCYCLITGQCPPDSLTRMCDPASYHPLTDNRKLKGRFSHAFLAGIDKALNMPIADRWQTCTEWLQDLQQKTTSAPTPATLKPIPLPKPTKAPANSPQRDVGGLIVNLLKNHFEYDSTLNAEIHSLVHADSPTPLRELAEMGDKTAQLLMGVYYDWGFVSDWSNDRDISAHSAGIGCTESESRRYALHYYEQAADQNYPPAQYALARYLAKHRWGGILVLRQFRILGLLDKAESKRIKTAPSTAAGIRKMLWWLLLPPMLVITLPVMLLQLIWHVLSYRLFLLLIVGGVLIPSIEDNNGIKVEYDGYYGSGYYYMTLKEDTTSVFYLLLLPLTLTIYCLIAYNIPKYRQWMVGKGYMYKHVIKGIIIGALSACGFIFFYNENENDITYGYELIYTLNIIVLTLTFMFIGWIERRRANRKI